MADELKPIDEEQPQLTHLLQSLQKISAGNKSGTEVLDCIVDEACALVGCDHLFLSRYDAKSRLFTAVTWHSSIEPGDVLLEKKFMGDHYVNHKKVVINDLSQYNYRLRPAVARMGLMSMTGLPIITGQGFVGMLEAFSPSRDYFSEARVELLILFAREVGLAMEREDRQLECKYLAAETDFLCETLKLEHNSTGSLLYKLGETFASLLSLDGIAVFGWEEEAGNNALQEVMAQGFSMSDIGRLKQVFNVEFIKRLEVLMRNNQEQSIVKQSLNAPGSSDTKLLYIVPVAWKQTISGIVVFYWQQAGQDAELVLLERFVKRIINHLSLVLGRKSLYSSIQRISFTDSLTDLANRRVFDYVLEREFKKAQRSLKPLSLVMMDIDYFKRVNDTYGHLAGDAVLEQLGIIIKKGFRSVDLPARYGGEEFAIILPDTNREAAVAIADRFRIEVAATSFYAGTQLIHLTISGGVATQLGHPTAQIPDPDQFIKAADSALYQAKQLGRNRIVVGTNR